MKPKAAPIAGIDYSMSCPCLCIYVPKHDDDEFTIDNCYFMYITTQRKYGGHFFANKIVGLVQDPKSFDCDIARYDALSDQMIELLQSNNCVEVALENYAYAAKGRVFNIGENTGLLKYKLYTIGHVVHTYEPTVIKKFATGKGNAKKEQMYDAFYNETAVDIKAHLRYTKESCESPISDIVDSYYICKYQYYLGCDPNPKIRIASKIKA